MAIIFGHVIFGLSFSIFAGLSTTLGAASVFVLNPDDKRLLAYPWGSLQV